MAPLHGYFSQEQAALWGYTDYTTPTPGKFVAVTEAVSGEGDIIPPPYKKVPKPDYVGIILHPVKHHPGELDLEEDEDPELYEEGRGEEDG